MSDPRHMHEFWPNRKGLCQRIIGKDGNCGKPEDDPVHQRFVEKHRDDQPSLEARIAALEAERDRLWEALDNIRLWCLGSTCEICGVKEMRDTDCYDYVLEALGGNAD